jgi:hypothetical protein
MKRKSAVFALVFAVSALIGIQAVEVADANPVPFPSVPNTDLPSLTVDTPVSPSPLYDNNTIAMDITVVQPDAWLSYYMGVIPYVGRCYGYVYLDGTLKLGFPSTQDKFNYYNISFNGYPATVLRINGYNVSFTNEKDIQHKLTIQLYCITFSETGDYKTNVTQDISFTIDSVSQTISFTKTPVMTDRGPYHPIATPTSFPIPTTSITPTPTLTPSSSPETLPPNTSFTKSAQAMIIIIASVIVVIVIVLISLVYFKRERGH